MSVKNDNKILTLKEEILKRRTEIGQPIRFNPVTTCALELFGNKINLHTINNIHELNKIKIELNMYIQSALNLQIPADEVVISGFSLKKWMSDIENKRQVILYNKKISELEEVEKRLDELLSDEKKTELEIDSIAEKAFRCFGEDVMFKSYKEYRDFHSKNK